MSFKAFCLRLACVLLVSAWASIAYAQAKHPIAAGFRGINGGSNMRFQIGNGLPVPITGMGTTGGSPCTNYVPGQGNCEDRVLPYPGFAGLPGGAPPATIGATTAASTGRDIYLHPGLMFGGGFPVNLGVFKANPAVFQVKTNIALLIPATKTPGSLPAAGVTFSAGGRKGPATVSFCPGLTTTITALSLNPACAAAATGKALKGVPGRMVYTKTKNQFGGAFAAGQGVGGTADVALVVKYDGALCKGAGCYVSFVYATPIPTGVNGQTFGATATSLGKKAYKYKVSGITSLGAITAIASVTAGKAKFTNVPLSFGGPWTTGMMTLTATATAAGGSEMFTRTGSDGRLTGISAGNSAPVGGSGNISLIASAVSQRAFTGPNANRGWITLTLPEPGALASAAGALLVLLGCHRLARRRSR